MLSSLPQVLSGEQVRCALHISKRKCAWMLNNGFIKCHNTGKRTRKYINIVAESGYISNKLIASSNAVVFSYVLYLIAKYDYKLDAI